MARDKVSAAAVETPLARLDVSAQSHRRRSAAIEFYRIDRLLPRVPRDEVIAGLAAGGEVVALAGPPGSGKSALAALVAACVAEGRPFLGRTVLPGAVFYIAAERAGEVERRLQAAASPDAAIYVSAARPQLAEISSIDDLIEAIRAVEVDTPRPVRLIIIDTAARCFSGLDENSSRDMGQAADGMTRVVEAFPTAVLLLLHHLDKGATAMRGSTALLGAVDLELRVQKIRGNRRVVVTKANAVAEGQDFGFRLEPRRSSDGFDVIEAVADGSPTRGKPSPASAKLPPDAQNVLDALRLLDTGNVVSFQEWRETAMDYFKDRAPGTARQAWSNASKRLIDGGYVVVEDDRVSISETSADHQQGISADAGEPSARASASPPSERRGADVADAPRRRAPAAQ